MLYDNTPRRYFVNPLLHTGGSPLKRLSGWDAVLLYSETPTVHMHTLKLAVIDLSELKGRQFGIDEFRQVIHSRLYKLDLPLRARRHPIQVSPPDVAGELRGRPRLPRPSLPGRQPRRTSPARRGGGPDRQHPAGPQQATVGDVLHRGPGQRQDRGARQDSPRVGRRGRIGQSVGAWDGPANGSAGRAGLLCNRSGAFQG